MVKFGRGTPSVTIGQFFTVQGGHHATKHVFAGTERIASKEYDPETKLYYSGARYYDPAFVRWTTSDPALSLLL